jgi:pseudaminic acid cytidylyltransferase
MPQDTVAIVPALGGSKRIPRKNIRPFLGRPILARVIEELRAAGSFSEIMVSTEDAEIAAVARASGAAVPFLRSPRNSGDDATTAAVLLEVVAAYEKLGRRFGALCCVYPTAVFVTPALLREGLRLLRESQADCVVPVLRYSFPIQRALRVDGGRLHMFHPEHMNTHSRDLPQAFHDAGQFYWLRTERFLAQKTVYMEDAVPLHIDELQAHDIDTEDDWRIAELKFGYLQQRKAK